ncbi:MAG: tRNA (adenosine(37)-N6)-threonylcarbamoyltransferase complex ATPase subunit type 1 TsaE [Bulleidia sp.]|nr:tRNA (adenosine(37)-N6)-threonylcarbamoyltransferase complex ATPase subunit type 1 TsaE [Erysipelotrichaceae bacterium]MDY2780656.1 tRNA (adenosine(37)-N6)-threonylcarbamoyltransferase complex ATPase subunit type 1 TsaE [Bulleidia sp.]
MQTLYTNNLEETHALGKKIGSLVKENMVILLNGDLGAGKTSLTQGIAKGLGITRNVTSPTFNILKIYYGRMALYHIDAYRLEGLHQELGFDEFLQDDGLTVIEWSEFVPELIPDHYLSISISLCEGDKRQFVFEANGKEYESLLEEIVC